MLRLLACVVLGCVLAVAIILGLDVHNETAGLLVGVASGALVATVAGAMG